MNAKLSSIILTSGILLTACLAWANPAMLPNHPGYPMGDAKDPVMGISVANDPGQSPPSQEESLTEAARFHDAQAVNPDREMRSSIVPPGIEEPQKVDAKSKSNP